MPIDGTNGDYEVSNYGNVRSLDRSSENRNGVVSSIRGKTLSQATDRWGYKTVILRIDKKSKTFRVHRLVAIAFIPRIPGKDFIDHIDNNKSNNHYSNLRWVTRSENALNPITLARQKEKCLLRRYESAKTVYQYTADKHFIKSYSSISEAARENNLIKSGIRKAAKGRYKTCGGFVWSLYKFE